MKFIGSTSTESFIPSENIYFEIISAIEFCNFRDFEIPLSMSLLLTQDSEELDHFYERGTEVISFGNEADMIDKANYYSNHLSEAEKIAKKGYERAIADHTWKKRFSKLFEHLES